MLYWKVKPTQLQSSNTAKHILIAIFVNIFKIGLKSYMSFCVSDILKRRGRNICCLSYYILHTFYASSTRLNIIYYFLWVYINNYTVIF